MHKWLRVTACVVSITTGVCASVKESSDWGQGRLDGRGHP